MSILNFCTILYNRYAQIFSHTLIYSYFISFTHTQMYTTTDKQGKICITLNQIYAIYYSTTIKNEDAWDFSYIHTMQTQENAYMCRLKCCLLCCLLEKKRHFSLSMYFKTYTYEELWFVYFIHFHPKHNKIDKKGFNPICCLGSRSC